MKISVKAILFASLLTFASVSVSAQDTRPVISPANAGTLTEIARLGQGHARYMVLSPDGTQVAVASDAGLRVLDSTTFALIPALDHKIANIHVVAYSPDGKYIAVGDYLGLTQVIDTATGSMIASFKSDIGIDAVAFHPARQEIITGGNEGGEVWDIASGNKITDLGESQGAIVSIVFTSDGRMITGGYGGKITYWDDNYHQINEIKSNNRLNDLALDPTNPNRLDLATGSFSDIVTVDGRDVHEQQLKVEKDDPLFVRFSHEGKWIAEGWESGHVYVRDAETGDQIHNLVTSATRLLNLQIAPKDDKIWALSYDDNLYIWDAATGKLDRKIGLAAGEMTAVAFSPDGIALVAAGKDDDFLHVWDMATLKEGKPFDDGRVDNSIAFSLDGNYLATGGEGDFHVHVWNVIDRKPALDLVGHTDTINSVAFSPDGKLVASASNDESTRVWDTQTGQLLYSITDPKSPVESVIFTTDSSTLLTSTFDDEVHFYNAKDGKKGDEFKAKIELVKTLSVNADTSLLAVGGFADGDTYTLNTTQKIKPIPATVSLSGRKMVFDPAGDLSAWALDYPSNDPNLFLIDLKNKPGQQLAAIKDQIPDAIVFSPDGTLLASALRNGYVVLYAAKS